LSLEDQRSATADVWLKLDSPSPTCGNENGKLYVDQKCRAANLNTMEVLNFLEVKSQASQFTLNMKDRKTFSEKRPIYFHPE
jgi:hypothetical protein